MQDLSVQIILYRKQCQKCVLHLLAAVTRRPEGPRIKPRPRHMTRTITNNSYKAFVAFQAIGFATTTKIPHWTMADVDPAIAATTKPRDNKTDEEQRAKSTMPDKPIKSETAAATRNSTWRYQKNILTSESLSTQV